MRTNIRTLILIILLSIIPTLLLWAPFFLRLEKFWNIPLPQAGMATIVSNFDGPLYILVAKTFYDSHAIQELFANLPSIYFAAHFPLFPLTINAISKLTLDYPYALIASSSLSSIFAIYYFYLLAKNQNSREALFLTFVFAVFPARWLIVRSIGSPEPLFIGAILASVYYFQKKKYITSGIFGALAQLTKSAGILLFFAYLLFLILPKISRFPLIKNQPFFSFSHLRKYYGLLIIPFSLILLFAFYKLRMNDFFAYFHTGDNIHLFFPPFQVFNHSSPWVGTFWLEEIIFIYVLAAFGIIRLVKRKLYLFASIAGVFLLSIIFVAHRDISRYILPAAPFLLLSYFDILTSKEFKIVLVFIIIPIYLFSLSFISQNTMPISNWTPYL